MAEIATFVVTTAVVAAVASLIWRRRDVVPVRVRVDDGHRRSRSPS